MTIHTSVTKPALRVLPNILIHATGQWKIFSESFKLYNCRSGHRKEDDPVVKGVKF